MLLSMVLEDLVRTPPLKELALKLCGLTQQGITLQVPGDPDHPLHWNERLQDQVSKRSCSKTKKGTDHGPRIPTTCSEKPAPYPPTAPGQKPAHNARLGFRGLIIVRSGGLPALCCRWARRGRKA